MPLLKCATMMIDNLRITTLQMKNMDDLFIGQNIKL